VHTQTTWGPAAGTGSREARVIVKDQVRACSAPAGPPATEGNGAHGAGGAHMSAQFTVCLSVFCSTDRTAEKIWTTWLNQAVKVAVGLM
jgi:hypothetical protein